MVYKWSKFVHLPTGDVSSGNADSGSDRPRSTPLLRPSAFNPTSSTGDCMQTIIYCRFLQSIDFTSNEPHEMFYELLKNHVSRHKTGCFSLISKWLTKHAGTVWIMFLNKPKWLGFCVRFNYDV